MNEYLTIAIEQEKRPVTYKLLARTQGMHVNAAKQALWEFLQISHNSRAVYCISGNLVTDDADRYTIRLVKDTDLEDAKKTFRTISGLHIYSLLPNDPKDLSVLVTASKDIPRLQLADRIKCGVIKSTALERQAVKHTGAVPAAATATATTKKASKPAPIKAPTSKTVFPAFKTKPTSSVTTTASKPLQLGKRDRESSLSKPKHVVEPASNPPKPVDREAQKALESSIFSDDDDEDNQMKDAVSTSRSSAPAVIDEEEESPQVDVMEVDEPEHKSEVNGSTPPPAAPGKVMRKVERTREFTDTRGYTISQKYASWEEVDAPAPAQKPTSSAPASVGREKVTPKATSKAKTGSKKKPEQQQQQMLTSWFTKK